jgi:hypothetical protein
MNQISPPVLDAQSAKSLSTSLNRSCFCLTLDRGALWAALKREAGDQSFCETFVRPRQHLFSNVPVFLPEADIRAMKDVVTALQAVSAMTGYRDRVLGWAPAISRKDFGPAGAFMGYDFHLDDYGPRLIEINTNAGGAFLNAILARAQRACCAEMERGQVLPPDQVFDNAVMAMFHREWKRQGIGRPLRRAAIVDESPEAQYLYPEFLLAQSLMRKSGVDAVIADPTQLQYSNGALAVGGQRIDLVYNRLVDFAFEQPANAALKLAYTEGAVAVTPNPHSHALLADKRNLTVLSDPQALADLGVPPDLRTALAGIPRTVLVSDDNADELWQRRKTLFFKPARGHGSKAVYRGSKLTRGVWQQIVHGDYVAQDFAVPGERVMRVDDVDVVRKMDVRLYAYGAETLLVAARLYQGQATNFRTPGGGFAPVFKIREAGCGSCAPNC